MFIFNSFTLLHVDGSCMDNNECTLGSSGCAHNCTNIEGSFQCTCTEGYVLLPDQRNCLDENECISPDGNHCKHTCVNDVGGYRCSCFEGNTVNEVILHLYLFGLIHIWYFKFVMVCEFYSLLIYAMIRIYIIKTFINKNDYISTSYQPITVLNQQVYIKSFIFSKVCGSGPHNAKVYVSLRALYLFKLVDEIVGTAYRIGVNVT